MRSYIFTKLERQLIQKFLSGDISASDTNLRKLLYRIRTFENLRSDIKLYLEASKAAAAKK